MAPRKIVWTRKANKERKEILEYWINRNQSKTYSIRLDNLFTESVRRISKNPLIGRKTELENIRIKVVRDYLVFYRYNESEIKILSVWDSRRDEEGLGIFQPDSDQ